jgi:hypothetical protein
MFAQTPDFQWGHGFGGISLDKMVDFAIDSKGNIVSVGTFYYTMDVSPSSVIDTLSSFPSAKTGTTKSQDIFITKYNSKPVKIILVDVLGNEVLQINNSPIKDGFNKNVDVSELSDGIYFLKVNNVVKQFIKN